MNARQHGSQWVMLLCRHGHDDLLTPEQAERFERAPCWRCGLPMIDPAAATRPAVELKRYWRSVA